MQPLQKVCQLGLDQGDLEYAGYAATHYGFCSYFTGQPLDEIQLILDSYIQTLSQLQQSTSGLHLSLYHESVLIFMGKADLSNYYEQSYLKQSNDRLGSFYLYLNKLVLSCFWQNVESAVEQANLDRKSTRLNSSHVSQSRMPSSA